MAGYFFQTILRTVAVVLTEGRLSSPEELEVGGMGYIATIVTAGGTDKLLTQLGSSCLTHASSIILLLINPFWTS